MLCSLWSIIDSEIKKNISRVIQLGNFLENYNIITVSFKTTNKKEENDAYICFKLDKWKYKNEKRRMMKRWIEYKEREKMSAP